MVQIHIRLIIKKICIIYNYNCQSDPLVEINCKAGELNRKILEKKQKIIGEKIFQIFSRIFIGVIKEKETVYFQTMIAVFHFWKQLML